MWQVRISFGLLVVFGLANISLGDESSQAVNPHHNSQSEMDLMETLEGSDESKRAWSAMPQGWGKRGWQHLQTPGWGKRGWKNLGGTGWGKRGWTSLQVFPVGKRAWTDLQNPGWGKREWSNLRSAWGKRAWSDLQGPGWGKRAWSDLQGPGWGKRAWSDLQGPGWGKRAWSDHNSEWRKQSMDEIQSKLDEMDEDDMDLEEEGRAKRFISEASPSWSA